MTRSKPARWLAYGLLLAAALGWGGNAVAGKFAVGHISPMLLTNLRWGVAALAALPFAWTHLARDWPVIRRHAVLQLSYGVIGFACFNVALYSALNYTGAINVVIEQAGVPGVIFVLSFLALRQRVAGRQLIGFMLTLAGVVYLVSAGEPSRLLGLAVNRGDALMLIAILCYGSYTVALRAKPPQHWLSFVTVTAAAAWLGSLPFAGYEYMAGRMIVPDGQGLLAVLFTALVPGLVAQTCYIRGNELIGANRAGLFFNFVPIFGTTLSVLLLGETLHLFHVIALFLVLAGVAVAERR